MLANKYKVAFCNIRPPGHHAERAKAMGFCLFNNVAVGAAYALRQNIKKIAIVDFDVHHGNGTEDIFKHDHRILYCSSFQHPFYPNSGWNTVSEHIINIPLPAGTKGDSFRKHIARLWFNAIDTFQPEIIFFSAGFDGHAADAMSNFMLMDDDYLWLTQQIKQIAQQHCAGRMISVLEGGYNLPTLGNTVLAHIQGLL